MAENSDKPQVDEAPPDSQAQSPDSVAKASGADPKEAANPKANGPESVPAESLNGESLKGAGNGEASPTEPAEKDPLTEAQSEAARFKEQLLRTLADFDNFRKRSRRELTDAELRGREELLRELLPVFDNLERAVAHAGDATDVQSLINGIKMVIRQFVDTLSRLSIERVATVGEPFDPSIHEAIQHLETDTVPPGSIANEIQGGYRMQQRLIRPAMVVVAKALTKAKEEAESTD